MINYSQFLLLKAPDNECGYKFPCSGKFTYRELKMNAKRNLECHLKPLSFDSRETQAAC